jgi:hypothetical protein
MIDEPDLERIGRGLIEALSSHVAGKTEGNHGRIKIAGVPAEI